VQPDALPSEIDRRSQALYDLRVLVPAFLFLGAPPLAIIVANFPWFWWPLGIAWVSPFLGLTTYAVLVATGSFKLADQLKAFSARTGLRIAKALGIILLVAALVGLPALVLWGVSRAYDAVSIKALLAILVVGVFLLVVRMRR
jgi:hypothetical protein